MVEIQPGQLLHSSKRMDFLPGFALEGFANRDSTIYGKLYGIQEAEVSWSSDKGGVSVDGC